VTPFKRKKRSWRNFPSSTSRARSLFEAETTRTSTVTGCVDPIGRISPSCRKRRSLAWRFRLMSATSSKKTVPPSAYWRRPFLSAVAWVNEPFLWPKSSDSRRLSGSALQFSETKGLFARPLLKCRDRAIASLPVPDSP
jgi:hypothetical protein